MNDHACSWIVSRNEQFKDCNCKLPATQEVGGRWWCDLHAKVATLTYGGIDGTILGRVSTKEQADHGYSMPAQVEESVKYAIANRIRVLPEHVFIEDISGVVPIAERPQGKESLRLLEQKAVKAIIAHKVDRYSRDIVDLLANVKRITRSGAQFHALDVGRVKNELDIVLVVKGWAGGDEHAKINEKMSKGRNTKAELGKVVGCGDPPFGYSFLRDERRKVIGLEIYEPEAQIIRLIYQWYVYGQDYMHPMSAWQIAKRLTADGILPPAQSRGKTKAGRGDLRLGIWNDGSVCKMIRNETYAGTWLYGKDIGKDGKHGKRPRDQQRPVSVPALVDREIWEKAQAQLVRNRVMSKRNAKHEYLLRGLIFCSCERRMQGRVTNWNRKSSPAGTVYYCCSAYKGRVDTCLQKYVRADKIEAFVWREVKGFFKNGRLYKLALLKAQKDELKSFQAQRDQLAIVEQQLEACEREARNCVAALRHAGEGFIAKELEEDRMKIDQRHQELTERRKKLLKIVGGRHLTDEAVKAMLQFREDVVQGIKKPTSADKRAFYERVGLTVHIDGETAQVKCLIRIGKRENYVSIEPTTSISGKDGK